MISKLKYSPILIGALLSTAYLLYGIFTSTNSTAAIGFLFVPVYALIGAILGGLVEHVFFLIQKKRALLSKLSAFYLIVLFIMGFYVFHKMEERQNLAAAEKPQTSVIELKKLLETGDGALQRKVLANPSLPVEVVRDLFKVNKARYDIASDIIHGPHLENEMVSEMIRLVPDNFPSKVEYELYQTYVWATLVRKKKVSSEHIHEFAAKPSPQHFLILALLESDELSCEEKKKFLPQTNAVLENAILQSMSKTGCP